MSSIQGENAAPRNFVGCFLKVWTLVAIVAGRYTIQVHQGEKVYVAVRQGVFVTGRSQVSRRESRYKESI